MFHTFFIVFILDFEQVNVYWVLAHCTKCAKIQQYTGSRTKSYDVVLVAQYQFKIFVALLCGY